MLFMQHIILSYDMSCPTNGHFTLFICARYIIRKEGI